MKSRMDSLQAIRAVAMIMVLLQHLEIQPLFGGVAVSLFFVLSGFLMAVSYLNKQQNFQTDIRSCLQFGYSKMKKLYPLHILMLVVSVLLILGQMLIHVTEKTVLQLCPEVLLGLFLVQAWVPVPHICFSLNSVSWYLSTALFLYICFPVIFMYLKDKTDVKKLLLCAVGVYAYMILWVFSTSFLVPGDAEMRKWTAYASPFLRIGDFIIGCITGIIFLQKHPTPTTWKATLWEGSALVLFFLSILCVRTVFDNGFQTLNCTPIVMIPASVSLVYLFARNQGHISKLLTNKTTVWLGDISPYIFLMHEKVINLLSIGCKYILHISLSNGIRFIIVFLVTLAASLIYLKLEKAAHHIAIPSKVR